MAFLVQLHSLAVLEPKCCNCTKNGVWEAGLGLEAELQESWRIVFFCFFGTVTQFGSVWIGLIGFVGTVTQFGTIGVGLVAIISSTVTAFGHMQSKLMFYLRSCGSSIHLREF